MSTTTSFESTTTMSPNIVTTTFSLTYGKNLRTSAVRTSAGGYTGELSPEISITSSSPVCCPVLKYSMGCSKSPTESVLGPHLLRHQDSGIIAEHNYSPKHQDREDHNQIYSRLANSTLQRGPLLLSPALKNFKAKPCSNSKVFEDVIKLTCNSHNRSSCAETNGQVLRNELLLVVTTSTVTPMCSPLASNSIPVICREKLITQKYNQNDSKRKGTPLKNQDNNHYNYQLMTNNVCNARSHFIKANNINNHNSNLLMKASEKLMKDEKEKFFKDSTSLERSVNSLVKSYRSSHQLIPINQCLESVHNNVSQLVDHPQLQYSNSLLPKDILVANTQRNKVVNQLRSSTEDPSPLCYMSSQHHQSSWHMERDTVSLNEMERHTDLDDAAVSKCFYLDPQKNLEVSNEALKMLQKTALQSYFERQQQRPKQTKLNSDPSQSSAFEQMVTKNMSINDPSIPLVGKNPTKHGNVPCSLVSKPPLIASRPPPPPRLKPKIEKNHLGVLFKSETNCNEELFNSSTHITTLIQRRSVPRRASDIRQELQPPASLNDAMEVNEWVPERPPKNPNLRIPSPDLPSPPPFYDCEPGFFDKPLPPPPPTGDIFKKDMKNNASMTSVGVLETRFTPNSFRQATLKCKLNIASGALLESDESIGRKISPTPSTQSPPPLKPRKLKSITMMNTKKKSNDTVAPMKLCNCQQLLGETESNQKSSVQYSSRKELVSTSTITRQQLFCLGVEPGNIRNVRQNSLNNRKLRYNPSMVKMHHDEKTSSILKDAIPDKKECNERLRMSESTVFDMLALRGENLSHNLPDVLPIDAKIQQFSTLAESTFNVAATRVEGQTPENTIWLNNTSTILSYRIANNFSGSPQQFGQNLLNYNSTTNQNVHVSCANYPSELANNTLTHNLKNSTKNIQNLSLTSRENQSIEDSSNFHDEVKFNGIDTAQTMASKLLEKKSPSLVREGSLRENIKITQFQADLISALSTVDQPGNTATEKLRVQPALQKHMSCAETVAMNQNKNDSQSEERLPKAVASLLSFAEESNTHQNSCDLRKTIEPRIKLPIEFESEQMLETLANMLSPNENIMSFLTSASANCCTEHIGPLYSFNIPQKPRRNDVVIDQQRLIMVLQFGTHKMSFERSNLFKTKVNETIKLLNQKVRILSKEFAVIEDETNVNDELGDKLIEGFKNLIRPTEVTKCRTYITDVGHITGLLLSLSKRLLRTENRLGFFTFDYIDKEALQKKRDILQEQLNEAKLLKEDIDRRGVNVLQLLERNCTTKQLADFKYFINMKAKLITDTRDISDKINIDKQILSVFNEMFIKTD